MFIAIILIRIARRQTGRSGTCAVSWRLSIRSTAMPLVFIRVSGVRLSLSVRCVLRYWGSREWYYSPASGEGCSEDSEVAGFPFHSRYIPSANVNAATSLPHQLTNRVGVTRTARKSLERCAVRCSEPPA